MPLSNDTRFNTSTVQHITDPGGGGNDCSIFALSVNVYFVTYVAFSGTNQVVYFTKTTDGGSTWSSPVAIDSIPNNSFNVYVNGTQVWGERAVNSPTRLLVTYRITDFSNSANNAIKTALSTDGGATWSTQTILANNTSWSRFWIDASNAYLITSNNNDGNLYLYKSSDWITWTGPTTVATTSISAPFASWVDIWGVGNKLMLALDNFPHLSLMVSNDNGATWSNSFANTFATGGATVTGKIRSLNGSTIYAFYVANDNTANSFSENGFYKSTDGGQTWTGPTRLDAGTTAESSTIGLVLANANEWVAAAGQSATSPTQVALYQFSNTPTPDTLTGETSLDAGDNFGNHVFDYIDMTAVHPNFFLAINYHNATNGPGTNTILLHKSNTAITGSFNDIRWSNVQASSVDFGDISDIVAVSDTVVYGVLDGYTPHGVDSAHSVVFFASSDGGVTWPVTSTVDTANSSTFEFYVGGIYSETSSPNTIYISYAMFNFNNSALGELRLAKSIDGGSTWAIQTVATGMVNTGSEGTKGFVQGNFIFLPWIDDNTGNIRVEVSQDGGTTWAHNTIDGTGPGSGWVNVLGRGNKIFAAYAWTGPLTLGLHPNHVTIAISSDVGVTWNLTTIYTTNTSFSFQLGSVWIDSRDGQNLWVFFTDLSNQVYQVMRSADGGSTWTGPYGIDATVGQTNLGVYARGLVCNATEAVVSYGGQFPDIDTDASYASLQFAQTADGGKTWTPYFVAEADQNTNAIVSSLHTYGEDTSITAVDSSHFWILGNVVGLGQPLPYKVYRSNTGITSNAFSAITPFAPGPTVISVHGETASGLLIHGEATGATIRGET